MNMEELIVRIEKLKKGEEADALQFRADEDFGRACWCEGGADMCAYILKIIEGGGQNDFIGAPKS